MRICYPWWTDRRFSEWEIKTAIGDDNSSNGVDRQGSGDGESQACVVIRFVCLCRVHLTAATSITDAKHHRLVSGGQIELWPRARTGRARSSCPSIQLGRRDTETERLRCTVCLYRLICWAPLSQTKNRFAVLTESARKQEARPTATGAAFIAVDAERSVAAAETARAPDDDASPAPQRSVVGRDFDARRHSNFNGLSVNQSRLLATDGLERYEIKRTTIDRRRWRWPKDTRMKERKTDRKKARNKIPGRNHCY